MSKGKEVRGFKLDVGDDLEVEFLRDVVSRGESPSEAIIKFRKENGLLESIDLKKDISAGALSILEEEASSKGVSVEELFGR